MLVICLIEKRLCPLANGRHAFCSERQERKLLCLWLVLLGVVFCFVLLAFSCAFEMTQLLSFVAGLRGLYRNYSMT